MRNDDTKRSRTTTSGHRCDDHRAQMIMHLSGRNDNARAGLSDFAPHGGIKIHQPNLTAIYHESSSSPVLPNSPNTSTSSPTSAIFLAASAQPLRTALAALRNTSASPSIVISAPASPLRPSCANIGLGITTPCEFPIRLMLTCSDLIVITMLFHYSRACQAFRIRT